MKKIALIPIVLLAILLAFPASALAFVPIPTNIIDFGEMVVDIPDAALSAKLHEYTGVTDSEPLRVENLHSLTGTLDLSSCGIANAEGIQYCTNVSTLSLDDNALSDMPDMSSMSGLMLLHLSSNNFSSVPEGICTIPNLEGLYLDYNPITRISTSIADLSEMKQLSLRNTELDVFPDVVLTMNLNMLNLSYTPIGEVPEVISQMTELSILNVDGTGIDSLPDSLCGMYFRYLSVADNNLYELPEGIGARVMGINAHGNRISSIPHSLLDSAGLNELDLSLNRLTTLPSEFADKTFSYVNIEFNFLDVSAGSEVRNLIDANNSLNKFYEHQLVLPEVTALAGNDSVTLGWAHCPDGSEDVAQWEVTGYVVYQYVDGEPVKLADLDRNTTRYTHEGLEPGVAYSYRIGVNYHVYAISPSMFESTTRGYARVDVTTMVVGEEAQTTLGVPAASPEAKGVEPDESYAVATGTPQPASALVATDNTLSTVAVIVISAGAAVLGAGIAALVILLVLRRRNKVSK